MMRFCIRFFIVFTLIFFNCFAYLNANKEQKMILYASANSPSKLIFNISEVLTSNYGMQTSVKFVSNQEILPNLLKGKRVDIVITESYDLLQDLKENQFINFSFVSEVFFDKLVYVPLKNHDQIENRKETIFFKTSPDDGDIIDNYAEKIPSILISSTSNICRKINTLRILYEETYRNIIVKESIAKKCDLFYFGFFNDLYNVYYMAIIVNNNFYHTKRIIDLFENSIAIKALIKNHGYNN